MRTFELVTAALIGSASAIKMASKDFDATYETESRAGNMGQTMTKESFALDNLDAVQDEIAQWYDTTAKPFINKHREQVYEASLAEAEEEFGKLLETCDEGTKCREDVEKSMKNKIMTIWTNVLSEFTKSIDAGISETRTHIDENWIKLVECGEKANCCEYQEITIQNLWIQVTSYREKIVSESSKWMEFEDRRIEMWNECTDYITVPCD